MIYKSEKMLNMIGIGLQMLTISVLIPYALYKTRMHIYINKKLEGVADQMIGYPIESSDQTLFWLCILMIVSVITIILAFVAAKNFKNRPKLTITLMFICAILSLVTSLPAVVIWIIAGIKTINTYKRNGRSEIVRENETSKIKKMDGFELGLLIASLSISILCIFIYALASIPYAMIINSEAPRTFHSDPSVIDGYTQTMIYKSFLYTSFIYSGVLVTVIAIVVLIIYLIKSKSVNFLKANLFIILGCANLIFNIIAGMFLLIVGILLYNKMGQKPEYDESNRREELAQ